MKKSNYILILIILIAIIGGFTYFYFSNNKGEINNNINTSKTSTDINVEATNSQIEQTQTEEILLSTYSSQIKDTSPGRLTNIRITCGILNETVINPNETFSFNKIVGKPTPERGYKEAKIIINHETENGIGGGNCQVSSTIYNAVLAVPTLTVTERHEHGKTVSYVPKGKDAAVSYGSLDLKFINTNDYKIKINVSTDDKNITTTLFKIEN